MTQAFVEKNTAIKRILETIDQIMDNGKGEYLSNIRSR